MLSVISRSPTELQPVLDAIAATAARLCGADKATIRRRVGNTNSYATVTAFGFTPEQAEYSRLHPMTAGPGSVAGQVAATLKTVHVPDIHAEPSYTQFDFAQRAGYRSVLSVPLLRESELIGILTLLHTDARSFSEEAIERAETFADQAVIAIENTRLFEEVQARTRDIEEALQQQTATADVLKAISRSAFDLQPVLETLVESATRLSNSDIAYLFRREGEAFRWVAGYGHEAEVHARLTDALKFRKVPADRGSITGRAALERKAVHATDVLTDPDYTWSEVQKIGGYRAALGVPLLRDNDVVGVIFVGRNKAQPFTPREVELVTTFADQAVIAIENVRLFEEVQARTRELSESLDHQTATSELLEVIGRSTTDLQPVFDTLAESAVRLCEAERAFVFRFDGEVLRAAAWHGTSPELVAMITAHPVRLGRQTIAARAGSERKTVHVHDVQADPEYTYFTKDVDPIRTVLAVPMLRGDELLGVTVIYRREVRPFSPGQVALMETFSDQAVIAIENARLFEEVQARSRDLAEALQYQTATGDVLGVISRSPSDLDPVLNTIVETAAKLCQADIAEVMRPLETDGDWYTAAVYGGSEEYKEHIARIRIPPGRGSVAGRVQMDHKSTQIIDATADDEFSLLETQRVGGFRTMLGVPLLREDKLLGIILMLRKTVRPFDDKHIGLAETFADQAVIAIENARLFEEVQKRTRDLTESLQQQTATADVLKVISRSAFDLDAVLTTLIQSAATLCGVHQGVIYLRDGDVLKARAQFNCPAPFLELLKSTNIRANPKVFVGRTFLTGEVVQIADTGNTDVIFGNAPEVGDFRAVLAVPMLREGRVEGVFALANRDPGAFNQRQIDLVTTFADQAVIAIENVRLFEEVQNRTRELARSVAEQKALGEVGQTISSTLDVQAVLSAILTHACHLANSGGGAIYTYDKSRGLFDLEAGHNTSEEVIARGSVPSGGHWGSHRRGMCATPRAGADRGTVSGAASSYLRPSPQGRCQGTAGAAAHPSR